MAQNNPFYKSFGILYAHLCPDHKRRSKAGDVNRIEKTYVYFILRHDCFDYIWFMREGISFILFYS